MNVVNQGSSSTTSLLASQQATGASNQTGIAYVLSPAPGSTLRGIDVRFACRVRGNGGATSPTVQAKVQGSWDKVVWFDIATGTAFAADNADKGETLAEVQNAVIPNFIRAVSVLGGGTPPTLANVSVWVEANGDFQLTASP